MPQGAGGIRVAGGCWVQMLSLLRDRQLFLPFQKQPCFGDERVTPRLGLSWGRGASPREVWSGTGGEGACLGLS